MRVASCYLPSNLLPTVNVIKNHCTAADSSKNNISELQSVSMFLIHQSKAIGFRA